MFSYVIFWGIAPFTSKMKDIMPYLSQTGHIIGDETWPGLRVENVPPNLKFIAVFTSVMGLRHS